MAGHPDDATRVGNPERERAIAHLNDAFAQGYLDVAEFEERSERVDASRTRGDLCGVLEHLPIAGALFPDATVMTAGSMTPSAVPTRPVEWAANWETVRQKGVWDAPASLLLSGTMGLIDLDFTSAVLTGPVSTVQLQASTSTIKIRVGPEVARRLPETVLQWRWFVVVAGDPTEG